MSSIQERNSKYRSDLFRHLDGIAVAPTAYELYVKGVLDFILEESKSELQLIGEKFEANLGYLNVALKVIASQGWIEYDIASNGKAINISTNQNSEHAFSTICHYEEVVKLLKFSERFHNRRFEKEPFEFWKTIAEKYQKGYISIADDPSLAKIQRQILKHIEGVLVGPTTVLLGMGGMFHKYFMETSFSPDEYHKDPESFREILNFFTFLEWFEKKGKTFKFSEKGLFFAKRSSAYGVTVSYIPTFRYLDDLIFGNPKILSAKANEKEKGVDREMNVWGSGGAHVAYFKKVDEIIIELFNRPIHEQPRGILDMGCGNGAFLIHVFDVIYQHTRRGERLEEFPLFLVGADFNEAALGVTRENLINSDVWAKVIWGDIGNPDQLAQDLKENYDINLGDLLNVRTFLDHNRVWENVEIEPESISISSGAFASNGVRLENNQVEVNLKRHLEKWKPYIQKFGLVIIELHGLDAKLIAQNVGKTASTAYEATHGFSDQYILEIDSFDKIVQDAGLKSDMRFRCKFPDSELCTVSINYLI
ncbi:MAG: class I SAM-dependent methyltransferase [Cyclobacteriaceae bacterium]